jgi:signal transduction histidine kinase
MFDLSYQVDPSPEEHASAGMALSVVKSLVEAMCGKVSLTLTRRVGQGSSFPVELPRVIASACSDRIL